MVKHKIYSDLMSWETALTPEGEKQKRRLMAKRGNATRKADQIYQRCMVQHSQKVKQIDNNYYSDLDTLYEKQSKYKEQKKTKKK